MADKFTELKAKYHHNVPADAVFLHASFCAFHLECPALDLDFSDCAFIGKELEGVLFYHRRDDLYDPEDERKVNYLAARFVDSSDDKTYAHVKFYNNNPDKCHAEFFAYDPKETVNATAMDGYSHHGEWKQLISGSANAFAQKRVDDSEFRLTVQPLGKKAQGTAVGALSDESVKVHGILYFKDINKIKEGTSASYNNDRIAFYEKSYNSFYFTAYFIPWASSTSTLGVSPQDTVELSGIEWSDV